MNICFREPSSFSEIKQLADFLWEQDLGYPNYEDWVFRARNEIDNGYKKAILAFDESKIVGNVVFQPHKELVGIREIKNLRVSPDIRCRRFGSFLLRQVEWHDNVSYDLLLADYRESQPEVEKLLLSEGFQVISSQSLYDDKIDRIAIKNNSFSGRVGTLKSPIASKAVTPGNGGCEFDSRPFL